MTTQATSTHTYATGVYNTPEMAELDGRIRKLLRDAEQAGDELYNLGEEWQNAAVEAINEYHALVNEPAGMIYSTDDDCLDTYLCDEINAGIRSKYCILRDFDPSADWHAIDAYRHLVPVYTSSLIVGLMSILEDEGEEAPTLF